MSEEAWRKHPLMAFGSVVRWMRVRRTMKTNYRLMCLSSLSAYCQYRGLTPDQLLQEYTTARSSPNFQDRPIPEDKLGNWYDSLTDNGKERLFNATNELTHVRPFFTDNSCPLSLHTSTPKIPKRERPTRATPELTRRIVDAIPYARFKWGAMNLAESGMRPTSMAMLELKHVQAGLDADKEPYLIELPGRITKTGQPYVSFVLEDAAKILREQIDERTGELGEIHANTRIVPFAANRFQHYFEELTLGLGINPSSGLRPFTTGAWRAYVQNSLEGSGVPANRVSLLMGAQPRGRDAHYTDPPPEILGEEYMKAADKLRIYPK